MRLMEEHNPQEYPESKRERKILILKNCKYFFHFETLEAREDLDRMRIALYLLSPQPVLIPVQPASRATSSPSPAKAGSTLTLVLLQFSSLWFGAVTLACEGEKSTPSQHYLCGSCSWQEVWLDRPHLIGWGKVCLLLLLTDGEKVSWRRKG